MDQSHHPPAGTEKEIFFEALDRGTPAERAAYLDGACGKDLTLRRRVQLLLDHHFLQDSFMKDAAVDRDPRTDTVPPAGEATVAAPPQEGPGTVIGRYKLLEKIGEGGFGLVYVAEQREPVKRRVALKIIKLGMDTREVVARFEAERQALALMDHPNIAKVLDAGATDTGRPYFVMELVKGIPLTKYCDQEKLGTRERLDLFIKVCHAIQHAHQKGIIHRDIKPSNILVTLHDGVPVPKVIDFGIARATQAELTEKTVYTQFHQFIGTPAYMSPEQAEMSGLDIDTRSDIYSLGVLLYELLTGGTPFDTKELLQSGLDEMRKIIRERPPVRPSTRLTQQLRLAADPKIANRKSQIANDLDWIVMKCLEKDRARRYETANGVAQDIERHLKHEPVIARPPSLGYRLQKSFRRNKLVFTAAGAVGMALLVGVVISSWQALRATKARRDETAARARADEAARVAESQRARAEKEAQKAKESELAARENLYDADMILAGQALQHNNMGRALNFLNRHQPAKAGERDLRGWEWRYLWAQCRSDELAKLGQHEGIVQSVAVSPDGRWVASGGWDGLLKLWELTPGTASGQFLTNLPLGGSPVSSVAFSPDGHWLAAGSWTNGFALFNAPGWDRAMTVTNTDAWSYRKSLAFSADSRLLAVGSEIWSLDTRKRFCALPCQPVGWGQNSVAWLPDSQTLAGFVMSDDVWWVSLFDLQSTTPTAMVSGIRLRDEKGTQLTPVTLAFSPDGRDLAVGCVEGAIRIHAANDWRQIKVLTNHTAGVTSLAFSKDGQWLASAGFDHSIRVWRTSDWQETAKLRGHEDEVWAVAFTPDGERLVSGSKDHSVRLWPLAGRSKPLEELTVPKGTTFFGLSGLCPFSVGPSDTLTIWDWQTLQVRQRLSSYPVPNVIGWRPSPDGRTLLMMTAEGGLWLTDLAAGAASPPVCLRTNGSRFRETAFSDQAKWLAVADGEALRVWDLKNQPSLPGCLLAAGNFWGLRFSRDKRLLGAVTGPIRSEQTVLVWDLASGKKLGRFQRHRDAVFELDFSPDSTVLATSSLDNTSKLFDLRTRQEITTLPGQLMSLRAVCFSADGRRLATGTGGGLGNAAEILIWDLETGREVLVLKAGASRGVRELRFHPDGDSLLSITYPGPLHLWRAPSWAEIEAAEKQTKGKTQW